MATVATLVDEIAALTISGVIRSLDYPPRQIATADLPISFVMPPSISNSPLNGVVSTCDGSAGGGDAGDVFTAVLVVATEAVGQNRQPQNYDTMVTMMDSVNAALKASSFTAVVQSSWQINAQDNEPIIVANTAYWGVTATITAEMS